MNIALYAGQKILFVREYMTDQNLKTIKKDIYITSIIAVVKIGKWLISNEIFCIKNINRLITAEELLFMNKEEISILIQEANEWLQSSEAEEHIKALGEEIKRIEEEYKDIDRIPPHIWRRPMDI